MKIFSTFPTVNISKLNFCPSLAHPFGSKISPQNVKQSNLIKS